MFFVGQKVVCIHDAMFACGCGCRCEPDKNDIGTIANIYVHQTGLVLELVEFPAPKCLHFDPGFLAESFRPIVDRKTDISVFTSLLNPTPQKVRESIGYDLGFTAEEIGLS